MKYLAFVMKACIMLIWVYMMYSFPDRSNPPFISGLGFFLTWLYLAIQGMYGHKFTGCIITDKTK